VSVHAPGGQHTIGIAVLAGAAHVIHDFLLAVFHQCGAYTPGQVIQHAVPRHALPLSAAPRPDTLHGVENPVGIFDLVQCRRTLRAVAAAAAGVERIALEFADLARVAIDVGQ
jgi:hypothetical protein